MTAHQLADKIRSLNGRAEVRTNNEGQEEVLIMDQDGSWWRFSQRVVKEIVEDHVNFQNDLKEVWPDKALYRETKFPLYDLFKRVNDDTGDWRNHLLTAEEAERLGLQQLL